MELYGCWFCGGDGDGDADDRHDDYGDRDSDASYR